MSRRRSIPWIYRYSRFILGGIALIGILITTYLTFLAFTGGKAACPIDQATGISSCDRVLSSAYAKIFGLPLSLYGLVAYITMAVLALSPNAINPETDKPLRKQVEEVTWLLLFIGSTGMAVFSAYLIYTSLVVIGAECYYCIGSALCSLALFIVTLLGREWEELGQLVFTGIIVATVTLVGVLGVYASVNPDRHLATVEGKIVIPQPTENAKPPKGWDITTTSKEAELALAKQLSASGAKMYGAFWCPHCYDQKQLFGKEAFELINYVECDPQGINPKQELCQKAGVTGFPSWEIKGKLYPGTQKLDKLAELSGYKGSTDFKYTLPQ
ncbi:vitamin K epoxide reductase family protein [Gloeothece verrucosa]|uniref:Vitamin K epoxide reductase n=1 Tax=Gloeothece verrucosa (strain PCC 7822) TaxID=497965 RepID=E0UCT4_GLOV7|nr:vitamin K epoxide reductase family protein [Gloeothece verrucosa]ADN15278.1 Vitamin K epoxide reductase [Gloeothece verrucosa PCC 7822]